MRRQLAGEHVGIGTRQIQVEVLAQKQTVDHRRKILDVLNLVQKDIRFFVSRAFEDVGVQLHRVAQLKICEIL